MRRFAALAALILCAGGSARLYAQATPQSSAGTAAERADALYRAGIAALQQRDLAAAQADFEQAVKLSPRSAEAHNSLGWVLLARQQLDAAIAEFNAALDIRTDFFQAYLNLSSALLEKGDAKTRCARRGRRCGLRRRCQNLIECWRTRWMVLEMWKARQSR